MSSVPPSAQDSHASSDPDDSRAGLVTAVLGGALGVVCALCGVGMLVAKWMGFHPAPIVSQIPLLLFPVAFVLLMVALFLSMRRRRRL